MAIDARSIGSFLNECRKIRQSILGNRTMSYKNLNDAVRRRALIPFLRAANTLSGILVVYAVEASVMSVFEEDWNPIIQQFPEMDNRKTSVLRRLFHVGHFASLAMCPWLAQGQHLTWITDDDDFTSDQDAIIGSTKVLAAIVSQYCQHDLGHFRFGPASVVDVGMQSEDLIAIADLTCGSVADTASLWHEVGQDGRLRSKTPLGSKCQKEKATLLAAWLASGDHSLLLRKAVVRLRPSSGGKLICEGMIGECDPNPEFDPRPILHRYR